MIDDDALRPAPVRVLCADGVFAPDVPVDVVQRYSTPREDIAPPTYGVRPLHGYSTGTDRITPGKATRPGNLRIKLRSAGRPRTRPVRVPTGKGHAWNRKDDCTVERILELQREGLTADQIGERLNCTRHTVYGRLRNAARSSPESAQMLNVMRLCACGRRKWATRDSCARCEKLRKKRT